MTFKPMLAAKDASKIRFPVLASPKLDGIRAIVRGGVVLSRSLKPIPNPHVQALFGHPFYENFDGELCVGPVNAKDLMQKTTSGVMSKSGTPDVTFQAFDYVLETAPYVTRLERLKELVPRGNKVQLVVQEFINNQADLDSYERVMLEAGFEGVMVRDPYGLYRYGRATAKGGELTKVKRFEDAEAVVVGFEERMHNDNPKEVDNLGHTKRSTHLAGKRGAGDLGALVCQRFSGRPPRNHPSHRDTWTPEGVEFNIGTGFTAAQRQEFWAQREALKGTIVKFKHFAQTGVVDAPRIPVFIGFRDAADL